MPRVLAARQQQPCHSLAGSRMSGHSISQLAHDAARPVNGVPPSGGAVHLSRLLLVMAGAVLGFAAWRQGRHNGRAGLQMP